MKAPLATEPKFDSLGRRPRNRRVSTGKKINLKPYHILWMEKLHRHGDLPSSYLYEFAKHLYKYKSDAIKQMNDLFHEGYLHRPPQQFGTIDARYQQLVYRNAPAAEKVLKEQGLLRDHPPLSSSSWVRDLLLSCFTASIDLACDHEYIHHDEIVGRIGTFSFPVGDTILRSDRIFGIRYKTGKVRLFIVEGDCNTEPIRASRHTRKSHKKNVEQYREFIGGGLYKKTFGIEGGVMLITVTTNETHMHNMLEVVSEVIKGGSNYMLFGNIEGFEYYFKPPKPIPHLFTGPWLRAGREPFYINQ